MIDNLKFAVKTTSAKALIVEHRYTFYVEFQATKTEIKRWIEGFFQIKVISINSHRLPNKQKLVGALMRYKTRYKRVIITVK
jgi:large subunit ribosomal protein L23